MQIGNIVFILFFLSLNLICYLLTNFISQFYFSSFVYLFEALRCLFWILLDDLTADRSIFYETVFFSSHELHIFFKILNRFSCFVFTFITLNVLLEQKLKNN
jgi:hypothetical protein